MTIKERKFKKKILAHGLAIAFGLASVSTMTMQLAYAQSNAVGSIHGKVDSPSGATIQIQNTDTGLKRTVNLDANGRYILTALPAGRYKVELMRNGKVADTQEFDLVIGQGTEASFLAAAAQQVTVSARRSRIDVSNTNNGAVFTARDLAKLPVQSNLTAVVLLAPNTTRGDAAYGNVASFGGGGVSENSYYINGLPVTNPLSQLGSTQLPWGAIAQTSVITGGFGAEFGRSIGGVLNITTRSGTNRWETGASFSLTPNSLRSKAKDIYYPVTGGASNTATDGKLHFRNSDSTNEIKQYGGYIGGPLVEDKLFMFAAVEKTIADAGASGDIYNSNTLARDGWTKTRTESNRFLTKFDWNITDDHRLELTSIGDTNRTIAGTYGYDVATRRHNDVKWTETNSKNAGGNGATSHSLKYTGNLTNDLTLTALAGQLKTPRGVTYFDGDPNGSILSFTSSARTRVPEIDPNLYVSKQKYGGNLSRPGNDEVKSFRLDLEYKLGQHTIRGGIDQNRLDSGNVGVATAGGARWSYLKVADGRENTLQNLSWGRPAIVANFGGFGTRGYYVRQSIFSSLTAATSEQSAQYIEDRYQATKNLLIVAGLRNDQYSNINGDGAKFIDMKNQLAPRLSASWDVNGDSSMKVFGSAGRYFLQLPTQVAARAASRSTLTAQDFTYSGVDSNGQPTGLRKINEPGTPDGELGQAKDPRSVVAKGLKPNFQDELTLGFEKAFNPSLNVGAKFTYRKLGAGIDDNCDVRPLAEFSEKNGIIQEGHPRDYLNCFMFNPGRDATVWIEGHSADGIANGQGGRYATISAKDMGFPKAERRYTALDFFAEKPFKDGWYGKVNYTWSRSTGNMEGQTNSDTGQLDVAITANWDFPEFMTYANGVLPNDRTHAIKAFGFYEFNKEWSMGANALLQSGRPKTCQGTDLDAEEGLKHPLGAKYGGPGYGASYMWCKGKPAPRGSLGRMGYEKRLDLSLTYKPMVLQGVSFGLDVFNVLNNQTALTRQETYDGGDGDIAPNYGEVRQLNAPRSMRLKVEFNHKF